MHLVIKPLLIAILFFSLTIKAESLPTTISAKPIDRALPSYPKGSEYLGQEAWVKLSFVIDETGKVIDPIVLDSSGLYEFERSAKRAVRKWQYSPAMQNGEPIQQCQNYVQIDFTIDTDIPGTVRKGFKNQYESISELINSGELEKAKEKLDYLGIQKRWNMLEIAWYWKLDTIYAMETDDKERQLTSIKKAFGAPITPDEFGIDSYLYFKQLQFSLHLERTEFVEAIELFETLQQLDFGDDLVELLEPIVVQVSALVDSDKAMVRDINLAQYTNWYHKLARNTFTLENVEGGISQFELRCDNNREFYDVELNKQWVTPRHWGECTMFFEGGNGKSFTLVELPNS